MSTWTPDEAAHELLHLLPLLNRLMVQELRRDAVDTTTMPQFRVLMYLTEQPQTMSTIARLRRVSLQSAAELVQTLVERGWIERIADPDDRRQSLLHITAEGRRQYESADARISERLIPLLRSLSESEMRAVQAALPALHRVLLEGGMDSGDSESS